MTNTSHTSSYLKTLFSFDFRVQEDGLSPEPVEHAHLLENTEKNQTTDLKNTDSNSKNIENRNKNGVNDNDNDLSFQPSSSTEGSTHTSTHTHSPSPSSSVTTTTTTTGKSSTSNISHILESDPSSLVQGLSPLQYPSDPFGAPSCLSLLHKLCVGPANCATGGGGSEGESDVGNGGHGGGAGGRGVNGVKGGAKVVSDTDSRKGTDKIETAVKETEKVKGEDAESEREKEELKDGNFLQSRSSETVEISFTMSEKHDFAISNPTIAPQHSYNTCEKHENTLHSGTNTPTRNPVSDCDISQKIGFIKQLEFMHRLTDLVEKLRFIDRAVRGDVLCGGLKKMNENPSALGV